VSARIPVGPALWTELEPIAELIAAAFHELPQDRWLVADPDDRRAVMPSYFRILVEQALATGWVHTSVDGHAVAVWMHNTSSEAGLADRGHEDRVAEATGAYAERFHIFEAALSAAHPAVPAHHHLALLAVRPGHQRQGYGSALLAHHHRVLDQLGLATYLEAATEASRAVYHRHGYHDIFAPFRIGEHGPRMWPMWRQPQPAPST
jgi:GNAT superfamily N-acetyltransferase